MPNKKESTFKSNLIKDIWRTTTIKPIAVTDSYLHGLPDTYIPGGNWIELKYLPFPQTKGWQHTGTNAFQQLRPAQVNRLNEFSEGGDNCFVGIFWQKMHNQPYSAITLTPWDQFKRVLSWSVIDIQLLGHLLLPRYEIDWKIHFQRGIPRNYDATWHMDRFMKWRAERPSFYVEHDRSRPNVQNVEGV